MRALALERAHVAPRSRHRVIELHRAEGTASFVSGDQDLPTREEHRAVPPVRELRGSREGEGHRGRVEELSAELVSTHTDGAVLGPGFASTHEDEAIREDRCRVPIAATPKIVGGEPRGIDDERIT